MTPDARARERAEIGGRPSGWITRAIDDANLRIAQWPPERLAGTPLARAIEAGEHHKEQGS